MLLRHCARAGSAGSAAALFAQRRATPAAAAARALSSSSAGAASGGGGGGDRSYYVPTGGHPGQHELLTGRAVFTEAYAVLPKGVIRDIVTSVLPRWDATRAWIIARPLSGFAETFAQYIVEVREDVACF